MSFKGLTWVTLDNETTRLLTSCSCDSACFDCLKHFQNQRVHYLLDRKSAIDLLNWGRDSVLPAPKSNDEQFKMLTPLENYIKGKNYHLGKRNGKIIMTDSRGNEKIVEVLPAMVRIRDRKQNHIYLNEGYLRFALPFTAKELEEQI